MPIFDDIMQSILQAGDKTFGREPAYLKVGKHTVLYTPDMTPAFRGARGLAEQKIRGSNYLENNELGGKLYSAAENLEDRGPYLRGGTIGAGYYEIPLKNAKLGIDVVHDPRGHPSVAWDIDNGKHYVVDVDPTGSMDRMEALKLARRNRVRDSREAMEALTDFLKWHSQKYNVSAYNFFPIPSAHVGGKLHTPQINSRAKLYQGMLDRSGQNYTLEEGPGITTDAVKTSNPILDVIGGLAGTALPVGGALGLSELLARQQQEAEAKTKK